eukprot:TRINITY_DN71554_c0_g1_i1.p1 TRINITY_DN71554_c0_g1~~TRINITY_DN71554_c0_g1_i1.p1  ORF type:complete len:320 (+),score=58.15 TRINITY_DN71554_c0_g1_i1:119-1078(+)
MGNISCSCLDADKQSDASVICTPRVEQNGALQTKEDDVPWKDFRSDGERLFLRSCQTDVAARPPDLERPNVVTAASAALGGGEANDTVGTRKPEQSTVSPILVGKALGIPCSRSPAENGDGGSAAFDVEDEPQPKSQSAASSTAEPTTIGNAQGWAPILRRADARLTKCGPSLSNKSKKDEAADSETLETCGKDSPERCRVKFDLSNVAIHYAVDYDRTPIRVDMNFCCICEGKIWGSRFRCRRCRHFEICQVCLGDSELWNAKGILYGDVILVEEWQRCTHKRSNYVRLAPEDERRASDLSDLLYEEALELANTKRFT